MQNYLAYTLNYQLHLSQVMRFPTMWQFCHVICRSFISFIQGNKRPQCWLYRLGQFHRGLMWQAKALNRRHLCTVCLEPSSHHCYFVGNSIMWLILQNQKITRQIFKTNNKNNKRTTNIKAKKWIKNIS